MAFGLILCGHIPLHGSVLDLSVIEAPINLVEASSVIAIGNQEPVWTELARNIF
jgi:hypothetical protein